MRYLGYIWIGIFFSACSEKDETFVAGNPITEVPGKETENTLVSSPNSKTKQIDRNRYTVRVFSALDFLKKKGETPTPNDEQELKKEGIVLLEIEGSDERKDFFEQPEIQLSSEDAMQYLIGNISEDIALSQGSEELYPSGVNFERIPGMQHKIRIVFFFKGIETDKKMKIEYYDRIFGSGIINFGINN